MKMNGNFLEKKERVSFVLMQGNSFKYIAEHNNA